MLYCDGRIMLAVLSKHLDDLEPTLARHGYRLRDLVEQFEAKPAEIKAWFGQQLEPVRAAELRDRLLARIIHKKG